MTRIRSAGPFGPVVVLVFLLGLLSAPLRPCDSHPGHGHAQGAHGPVDAASTSAGHTHHLGTVAQSERDSSGEDAAAGGCDCLGLCSLEQAPFLPLQAARVDALAPGPDQSSVQRAGIARLTGDPAAVPLARGPPLPV